jgi:hypothetical protein
LTLGRALAEDRPMRRALLLVSLLLTLGALPAHAQTQTVETNLTEGFFYYSLVIQGSQYTFGRVAVYDADPGTVVRLSCPAGAACPFPTVERVVGPDRVVNLIPSRPNSYRFRRGQLLELTRTHPDGRKTVSDFRMTKTGFDRFKRVCSLGDGSPSPCVVDCPVGGTPSPTPPCSEVTRVPKLLPPSVRVDWTVGYARNGDTRFKRLTLRNLPAGTSVFLLCIQPDLDTPCRKYVQFFPPGPPGPNIDLDLTSLVSGRSLPPGTTVTLRLRKPGYRRQELRYTTHRNRPPTRKAYCLDPGHDEARPC